MRKQAHPATARFSAALITLGLFVWGVSCSGKDKDQVGQSQDSSSSELSAAPATKEFVPLTPEFLTRATAALDDRLKPHSQLLELRVTGSTFSFHMRARKDFPATGKETPIKAGALVQIDYVERATEPGQPPLGKIYGPRAVPTVGKGELEPNLFAFSEVNLPAIARAFPLAKIAIDPTDGQVERLVIRRNLPFGMRVRGRIYVRSPRLSGSIDVNEKGAVLKR